MPRLAMHWSWLTDVPAVSTPRLLRATTHLVRSRIKRHLLLATSAASLKAILQGLSPSRSKTYAIETMATMLHILHHDRRLLPKELDLQHIGSPCYAQRYLVSYNMIAAIRRMRKSYDPCANGKLDKA